MESSEVQVADSSFADNRVSVVSLSSSLGSVQFYGSGGAVAQLSGLTGRVTLVRTNFTGNSSPRVGGALFAVSAVLGGERPALEASACVFANNSVWGATDCPLSSACVAAGGAVYLDLAWATLRDCSFTHNHATTSLANSVSLHTTHSVTHYLT